MWRPVLWLNYNFIFTVYIHLLLHHFFFRNFIVFNAWISSDFHKSYIRLCTQRRQYRHCMCVRQKHKEPRCSRFRQMCTEEHHTQQELPFLLSDRRIRAAMLLVKCRHCMQMASKSSAWLTCSFSQRFPWACQAAHGSVRTFPWRWLISQWIVSIYNVRWPLRRWVSVEQWVRLSTQH